MCVDVSTKFRLGQAEAAIWGVILSRGPLPWYGLGDADG